MNQQDFDRLVVYADGSSISSVRHQPPLLSDFQGLADTWAFLVLGEVYGMSDSQFYLWGWQAQPVHYHEDSRFHLGTLRTGSDLAEKEALFWSAIWRLSVNLDIPTVFCSDSATTCGQARGDLNARAYETPFVLLRSVFQALEALLPSHHLLVPHVVGHSNDPWNDFVDFAAKTERDKSFYLPRPPSLDFRQWRLALPALWMIFNFDTGLPRFTHEGSDAPPPKLPVLDQTTRRPPPCESSVHERALLDLSLSTVNLLSLSRGSQGHDGRVDYLREQFRHLRLNAVGLQETRSEKGLSAANDVVRIASGASRGHFGVELWINLDQPYGRSGNKTLKFHRRQCSVRHAGPRILLVHLMLHLLTVCSL